MDLSLGIFGKGLLRNNRFYILLFSVALSVFLVPITYQLVGEQRLRAIRLEQIYGFASLTLLYLALIVTPLGTVFPRFKGLAQLNHARRALGVGSFYFALLHALVSVFGQLGGLGGLQYLGGVYVVSLVIGTSALILLLLLAVTSFDYAIKKMSFPRWKRLHQLIYPGFLLILLHIVLISSHLNGFLTPLTMVTIVALTVFGILQAMRLDIKHPGNSLKIGKMGPFTYSFLLVATVFLLSIVTASYQNLTPGKPTPGHDGGLHASAHSLVRDGTIGAILHIDPNDEPVAGEPSNIYFEVKDSAGLFNYDKCDCQLQVTRSGGTTTTVDTKNGRADYTFPERGLYKISLVGTPINDARFTSFQLDYDIRVDTGTTNAAGETELLKAIILAGVGIAIMVVIISLAQRRASS